jgi:hypothetical protein
MRSSAKTWRELLRDPKIREQSDYWLRHTRKARTGQDFWDDGKSRKKNSLLSDPAATLDELD